MPVKICLGLLVDIRRCNNEICHSSIHNLSISDSHLITLYGVASGETGFGTNNRPMSTGALLLRELCSVDCSERPGHSFTDQFGQFLLPRLLRTHAIAPFKIYLKPPEVANFFRVVYVKKHLKRSLFTPLRSTIHCRPTRY